MRVREKIGLGLFLGGAVLDFVSGVLNLLDWALPGEWESVVDSIFWGGAALMIAGLALLFGVPFLFERRRGRG